MRKLSVWALLASITFSNAAAAKDRDDMYNAVVVGAEQLALTCSDQSQNLSLQRRASVILAEEFKAFSFAEAEARAATKVGLPTGILSPDNDVESQLEPAMETEWRSIEQVPNTHFNKQQAKAQEKIDNLMLKLDSGLAQGLGQQHLNCTSESKEFLSAMRAMRSQDK
ncbi:MAG: hypothetical protein R3261_03405 [Alphaproteobacteria bacterium]|nr:hypothetical protein [Alphaproteobacteria bacterium]